jgi:DNA-binding NarL/FixJ family response regulator
MATVTVSVVEDDLHARQILGAWLGAAEGFECLSTYATAEQALTQLPREKPNVVLMDINLPKMTGIECVRRLKPVLPDTQFIMLTVYEDSDHIFNALSAGASGYLLKQLPCDELLASLKEVHQGGSPMTGSVARKVVQHFQPSPNPASDHAALSPREREVLELLARGYLYKEIADALKVSVPTVNAHIRHIYEKMHVRSRGQAVAQYAHLVKEPAVAKPSRP